MFKIISTHINYLAKIVKINNIRRHSNADRLNCTTIDGNNIICGLDTKVGDLVVYFPLECSINKDFLSWSNSFQDKTLNQNNIIGGFFDKNGRVRCLKLRGERSEGYVIEAEKLSKWLNITITEKEIGLEFDTYKDITICEKYISVQQTRQQHNENKQKKKVRLVSKIIDGQYRLAEETAQLKKNLHRIQPSDTITISCKMHGTNFSMGNVICKKKLKFYEKTLKYFGVNIIDTHNDLVWASRRIIKNQYEDKVHNHLYNVDIWSVIANKYKDSLQKGLSIHGEIVGQLPGGGWIQKNYDYGLDSGTADLFVYRIFYTNPDGKVFEFSTPQIIDYCNKHGLKTVPILYYGKAASLYLSIEQNDNWHEEFLAKLKENYLEKDCFMCKNKVPAEGIVLTKESDYFEPFKLKSFAFLQQSTQLLDSGEIDIDDLN